MAIEVKQFGAGGAAGGAAAGAVNRVFYGAGTVQMDVTGRALGAVTGANTPTTAALVHSVALRPVLHLLTGGFADVVHAAR